MTILAGIYGDPTFSDPIQVLSVGSHPVRVLSIRSGPIQSDPIRYDPGFVNAQEEHNLAANCSERLLCL